MVTLDEPNRVFLEELTFLSGFDGGLNERGEIDPGRGIAVNAAGHIGELAERVGFEFGKDDGAAVVFDETVGTVGNHRAGGGADAKRQDADVFLFQFLGGGFPRLVGGFTVREDDEKTIGRAALLEGGERGRDEGAVIGAAFGQIVGAEIGEKFTENLIVGAERRLQKRRAREYDETDALASETFEQRLDEELGALEARRFDVGREHRAREIDGEEDFPGLIEDRLVDAAVLRAGEGGDGERETEK